MAEKGKGTLEPGLAGGPGPAPRGFDDGTPHTERADGDLPAGDARKSREEAARRSGDAPGGAKHAEPGEDDLL